MVLNILKSRSLYLPALIIVAVVLFLLIFIGFSTYWNLDRARNNALRSVHQQGIAIADVLGTTILAIPEQADKEEVLLRLVNSTGNNKAVTYVYIADDNNVLLYHSKHYEKNIYGVWHPGDETNSMPEGRIRTFQNGRMPVYEIGRKIFLKNISTAGPSVPNRQAVIVVGMEMHTFETARQEDLRHAVIMVSILAALALGSIFFMFVINRYHQANRDLKENQEYTRQVVENMANGLLSIDLQGKVISSNNQGIYLLGLQPDQKQNIHLNRFIDLDAAGISETLSSRKTVMDREIEILHENGQKIPVAVSGTPILSSMNKCDGAVIILRDLREIKRLEDKIRNTEKLAALGRMAAAVAHEIRNPLSSIRGFAQFLGQALKDRKKEHEYAMIMIREVDRMNRVITDLLNFARPLEIEPVLTDPHELLSHAVQLIMIDAKDRGIDIRLYGEDCCQPIRIDANLMTQVLLNLLLNALQSVEDKGHVNAGVRLSGDGRFVVFEIEDDGAGIDKDDIGKIFDPFFTTREKGTGLGLAIVRKIVENHGGGIHVASPAPGKEGGCMFSVRLPVS